jgi:hypothetical protein
MNTENQRKRELRTGVKAKYTAYLNEIYKQIKNDEYINMNLLTSMFNIGKQASQILQSEKIIKKITKEKYIWIGKRPSSQMVDLIIERARMSSFERLYPAKETGQKQIDFKAPIAKPIDKPVPEKSSVTKIKELKEQKQNYSLSLFWGLIKISKS